MPSTGLLTLVSHNSWTRGSLAQVIRSIDEAAPRRYYHENIYIKLVVNCIIFKNIISSLITQSSAVGDTDTNLRADFCLKNSHQTFLGLASVNFFGNSFKNLTFLHCQHFLFLNLPQLYSVSRISLPPTTKFTLTTHEPQEIYMFLKGEQP